MLSVQMEPHLNVAVDVSPKVIAKITACALDELVELTTQGRSARRQLQCGVVDNKLLQKIKVYYVSPQNELLAVIAFYLDWDAMSFDMNESMRSLLLKVDLYSPLTSQYLTGYTDALDRFARNAFAMEEGVRAELRFVYLPDILRDDDLVDYWNDKMHLVNAHDDFWMSDKFVEIAQILNEELNDAICTTLAMCR